MNETASCDGICLEPACPRITNRLEPTREGEGEKTAKWRETERIEGVLQNNVALGLIATALAFY